MPEAYRDRHLAGMNRYNRTHKAKVLGDTVELKGLRKNGEIFPIELSLSTYESGMDRYFTGIIRDISSKSPKNSLPASSHCPFQI